MHVVLFIITGWVLLQLDRKAALIFITSPLIIIEGLINTHNDFVALSLAIIGIYLLQNKRKYSAIVVFVVSGLIKYISLPILILSLKESFSKYTPVVSDARNTHFVHQCHPELASPRRSPQRSRDSGSRLFGFVQPWHIALTGILALLVYLISRQEIQPWYFLNLFIFLPFAPDVFQKFTIASTGLLLSYYPYVLGGEWGQGGDVGMKRSIILYSLLLNVSVLFVVLVRKNLKHLR
jgi:hypothetical protein